MKIPKLSDILVVQAQEFVDKLLNSKVTISEKLDGSTFYLTRKNNVNIFYKSDISNPINLIDRTVSLYWEKPLTYLENLDLMYLPDSWKFQFEYFFNPSPFNIAYENIPKNNLVLTGIWDNRGNLIEDPQIISKFISLFNVELMPIIFSGFLTEVQKNQIKEYLITPIEKIIHKFSGQSFTGNLIKIINPSLTNLILSRSIGSAIESLIFRFNDEFNTIAFVIDPKIEELLKQNKYNKTLEPKNIYYLILIDILHFVSDKNINKISLNSETPDSKYLELMSILFNEFIESNLDTYENLQIESPTYASDEIFLLNVNNIKNYTTLNLVKSNSNYAEIFKIFLTAFKKKKKKFNFIFTPNLVEHFNKTVEEIQTKISNPVTEIKGIIPYSDYKKKINVEINEDLEDSIELELDLTEETKPKKENIPKSVIFILYNVPNKDLEEKILKESELCSTVNIIFIGQLNVDFIYWALSKEISPLVLEAPIFSKIHKSIPFYSHVIVPEGSTEFWKQQIKNFNPKIEEYS